MTKLITKAIGDLIEYTSVQKNRFFFVLFLFKPKEKNQTPLQRSL